jgi:AcrR family transcriptional regulator
MTTAPRGSTAAPTRRERLRTSTVSEIKEHARRLLVDGGVEAVSLRAIARDMGMTAPAIYRYFPSLDALVEDMAADIFDELRDVVVAARERAGDDRVAQIREMARAFREWSVTHTPEYTLILGNPLPGIVSFQEGCVDDTHPGAQFGQPFMEVLADLWEETGYRTPPRSVMEERLAGCLDPLFMSHGNVKIEVAWAFLTGWARLYGLVSMEVFQHMRWAVTEPRALFELELSGFIHQLGLPDR